MTASFREKQLPRIAAVDHQLGIAAALDLGPDPG
jgi:hypothetical protein